MERKLEQYCKIKDNNLRFEWMSLWVFQFVSWCVRELLVFREIISRWFDLFCTSCMRKMFILCWHHRENKRLLMDRNIKSQDDFILWVVCDTAKVRFFKQITTPERLAFRGIELFAILQKCDFSSKSQVAFTADLWGMVARMAFSTCCGAWAMCRLFVWHSLSFLVKMFSVLVLFCIFALAH